MTENIYSKDLQKKKRKERKNKMQTNIIYNTDCLALKDGLIDLPKKRIAVETGTLF